MRGEVGHCELRHPRGHAVFVGNGADPVAGDRGR